MNSGSPCLRSHHLTGDASRHLRGRERRDISRMQRILHYCFSSALNLARQQTALRHRNHRRSRSIYPRRRVSAAPCGASTSPVQRSSCWSWPWLQLQVHLPPRQTRAWQLRGQAAAGALATLCKHRKPSPPRVSYIAASWSSLTKMPFQVTQSQIWRFRRGKRER